MSSDQRDQLILFCSTPSSSFYCPYDNLLKKPFQIHLIFHSLSTSFFLLEILCCFWNIFWAHSLSHLLHHLQYPFCFVLSHFSPCPSSSWCAWVRKEDMGGYLWTFAFWFCKSFNISVVCQSYGDNCRIL